MKYDTCGICDGRGVIMAPQMTKSPQGGTKKLTTRAFRCSCYSGMRFLGVSPADEDAQRHGVEQVQASIQRTIDWFRALDLDYENDPEETLMEAARKRFRDYKHEKMFTKIK